MPINSFLIGSFGQFHDSLVWLCGSDEANLIFVYLHSIPSSYWKLLNDERLTSREALQSIKRCKKWIVIWKELAPCQSNEIIPTPGFKNLNPLFIYLFIYWVEILRLKGLKYCKLFVTKSKVDNVGNSIWDYCNS